MSQQSIDRDEKIEYSQSFSVRHVYDVDAFDILDNLRKNYPDDGDVKISREMTNSSFFELQEDALIKDCGIDFLNAQKLRFFIIPPTSSLYPLYLAWKISLISGKL